MLSPDTQQAIQEVLARHEGVRLAILFGSMARGTARDDSDLDLAVDVAADEDLGQLAAELSERPIGSPAAGDPPRPPPLDALGPALHTPPAHCW